MKYYKVPIKVTIPEDENGNDRLNEKSIGPDMEYFGGMLGHVLDENYYLVGINGEISGENITELTYEEALSLNPNVQFWKIV